MAYFYNSNYSENYYNYQYYYDQYNYNQEPRYVHQYSNTELYGNAYQHATTPSVVGYYYSSYNNQPEFYTSKNANIQENDGYYYDHVSTQYVVSYNSTTVEEADEVVGKEDVPKTFHGGYDINEKYGKPLPPSDEICYPHSKYDPKTPALGDVNFESIPSPYLKEDKKEVVSEGEPKKGVKSEVIQEEKASDFEDDEEDEDYDEEDDSDEQDLEEDDKDKEPSNIGPIVPLVGVLPTKAAQNIEGEAKVKDSGTGEVIQGKGNLDEPNLKKGSNGEVIQGEKALELEDEYEEDESEGEGEGEGRNDEDYGSQVRRQIPPGYGMEAYDICEGLFGGYFPCLWKRNQRIYNHQRDVNEGMSDYDYCWKESADFLFGNPNPYGGTMPEKGSYGDPVYNYHRHYPQQHVTRQVENCGDNYSSYLQNSGYFYGHDGES